MLMELMSKKDDSLTKMVLAACKYMNQMVAASIGLADTRQKVTFSNKNHFIKIQGSLLEKGPLLMPQLHSIHE